MARLDQERQNRLEPRRMESCLEELMARGYIADAVSHNEIFIYACGGVKFWPYSGWHTGKLIKDGRGFKNLLAELDRVENDEGRNG